MNFTNAKLERSSKSCYSIVDGGNLRGFAMRLENGLWGMFRPNLTRFNKTGYLTARDVKLAFQKRKPEARLS